jgi:hypothetical protein
MARQTNTRHDKSRQGKTRQDKSRQDKTRQRQGKSRQGKTSQDKARQVETRQGKASWSDTRVKGKTSQIGGRVKEKRVRENKLKSGWWGRVKRGRVTLVKTSQDKVKTSQEG